MFAFNYKSKILKRKWKLKGEKICSSEPSSCQWCWNSIFWHNLQHTNLDDIPNAFYPKYLVPCLKQVFNFRYKETSEMIKKTCALQNLDVSSSRYFFSPHNCDVNISMQGRWWSGTIFWNCVIVCHPFDPFVIPNHALTLDTKPLWEILIIMSPIAASTNWTSPQSQPKSNKP
jgi:hypothetical protein